MERKDLYVSSMCISQALHAQLLPCFVAVSALGVRHAATDLCRKRRLPQSKVVNSDTALSFPGGVHILQPRKAVSSPCSDGNLPMRLPDSGCGPVSRLLTIPRHREALD